MSAETLRRAASLMRERAARALMPPWHVDRRDDGRAWICETAGDGTVEQTLALHGFPSTAEHIASWHPAVALAVADLLDRAADDHDDTPCPAVDAALAVARAYLGESS